MLHKVKALLGYHIRATDGEIGHVDDVLIDDTGSDFATSSSTPATGLAASRC